MEQKTEARTLVEQGDTLLADGRVMEAAAAFAQAVQVEPEAVGGHLGLAEANLALGVYSTVYLACRQVQTLAPNSADAALARAILFVLERRYDAAVQELDRVAALDPGRAYAHALRGYCLRLLGHTYDAQQAESKARRLSSGKEYTKLFPQVVPPTNSIAASQWQTTANGNEPRQTPVRDPGWERQRQAIRARFSARHIPVVTYTLIAINVIVYALSALSVGGNFLDPTGALNSSTSLAGSGLIYTYGVQVGALMQHDPLQWYRVLTAMFLHANIEHIALNMLSLYFVGVATEQIFGRWRFALIYFASGIIAGVTQFFLTPPNEAALGASGAIFGIFGAFGAFVILRRQMLGRAASPIIGQWIFFLLINLVFSFTPGIALYDHVGGLVSGFILGALLIPSFFRSHPFG
jgi:membrane associated rhomboid family serine protease